MTDRPAFDTGAPTPPPDPAFVAERRRPVMIYDPFPETIPGALIIAAAAGDPHRAEAIEDGLQGCGWRPIPSFGEWKRPMAPGDAYFLAADGSDPGGPLPQWTT